MADDLSRANLSRRLAAAQRDIDEKHDAWRAACELRRDLIVQAVDQEGMTHREVAIALKLSPSRIYGILGSDAA